MGEKLLEIKNLRIEYVTDGDAVQAVNGIDLSIERGQSLGLVGETGAGKTTTALSILRLLPKYTAKFRSGSITFDGLNILSVPEEEDAGDTPGKGASAQAGTEAPAVNGTSPDPSKKARRHKFFKRSDAFDGISEAEMRMIRGGRIAMIFQDPMTSLDPVISVRDQIAEVLLLHRPDLDRKSVDAEVGRILELVGIPASRMNEYPHQFSGGMKQRVVIAIAIACDPELLIADEPTTALDVTIQAQVLSMMRKLKRELNSALLLITHDLGVVASICDVIGIMYAGEIVEFGTLEDIFDPAKKHHPYTAGLFGSIPNLTTDTERLDPIPGLMPDPTALPEGCNFGPRCPHYDPDRCGGPIPAAKKDQHQIKCVLFRDADL